jgi:hypothetical protein
LLSQEEIFFSNKLQEVEDLISELLESNEGQDVTNNQELTDLQASRDLYKKQLHRIEVENMMTTQTLKDKTLVSKVY